jgi:hypothetical protein
MPQFEKRELLWANLFFYLVLQFCSSHRNCVTHQSFGSIFKSEIKFYIWNKCQIQGIDLYFGIPALPGVAGKSSQ